MNYRGRQEDEQDVDTCEREQETEQPDVLANMVREP